MARRVTKADRIRKLHEEHPDWSQAQIARHLRTSRSAVHAALSKHAPWGRAPLGYVTITLRVRRDLMRHARERAGGKGIAALAGVLVRALEEQLVPEEAREQYEAKAPSKGPRTRKTKARRVQ